MVGMVKGHRGDARLKEHFGEAEIGDLEMPFFAVSTNLTDGAYRVHRRGLGHGHFVAQPSKADFRKLITAAVDKKEQERLIAHSHSLARHFQISTRKGVAPVLVERGRPGKGKGKRCCQWGN